MPVNVVKRTADAATATLHTGLVTYHYFTCPIQAKDMCRAEVETRFLFTLSADAVVYDPNVGKILINVIFEGN
jgi:hypothetical protein